MSNREIQDYKTTLALYVDQIIIIPDLSKIITAYVYLCEADAYVVTYGVMYIGPKNFEPPASNQISCTFQNRTDKSFSTSRITS
jgi:hypothetical protein